MRLLKNTDTGVICGYTEGKAALENMEEVHLSENEVDGLRSEQPATVNAGDPPAKTAPTTTEGRIAEILAAMNGLDRSETDDFTTTGKPKVPALEKALGYNISATERDEAWSVSVATE